MDLIKNFPYENFREGQKEFIKKVEEVIISQKQILVSAPTGLGKTISALFPALSLAKKLGKKVIFLTSRQTQVNQAIKTIKDICENQEEVFNYVAFIGKSNMCAHENRSAYLGKDFNEFCKRSREHKTCSFYTNVKNKDNDFKIKNLIKDVSSKFLDVEDFVLESSFCKFCPYEVASLKSKSCDVIICDYNYIFSPEILKSFLGRVEAQIEDFIIIVDEAHNLSFRVQSSNTYSLSNQTIEYAISENKELTKSKKCENFLTKLQKTFRNIYVEKLMEKNYDKIVITKQMFLERFLSGLDVLNICEVVETLEEVGSLVKENSEKLVSQIESCAKFLKFLSENDFENFLITFEKEKKKDSIILKINITPLDVSIFVKEILEKTHSSILMSATLNPLKMYQDILGLKNAAILELESPFPKENLLVLVDREITTKFTQRSESLYKKIAENLTSYLNSAKNLNSLVFFPSYVLLNCVLKYINVSKLDRKILQERRFMSKEEKERFTKYFKEGNVLSSSCVLFAVTSGSFAEGLDLPGNFLNLVIVVGLPLTIPDCFVHSQIAYYDKKFGRGQEYAYVNPAINKIVQASGRCIRTKEDKGIIILMDTRFLFPQYALNFPKHWKVEQPKNICERIEEFF